MGPVNWAGRTAQVEVTVNTVQEGHTVIADTIIEKKMKARGPGHPQGSKGATWPSAATCNVDDWMLGLDEGTSDKNMGRTGDVWGHQYEEGGTHTQHVGGGGRQHRWQGPPGVPRGFSEGSPSSWGGSSDCKSDQSPLHSTIMGASSRSNRSVSAGRDHWVKISMPIFKDEKSKDAVTYHSWQWDVALFCQCPWDDQNFLPYIFCSLQGFLDNLARSLGEDAILIWHSADVRQILQHHHDVWCHQQRTLHS